MSSPVLFRSLKSGGIQSGRASTAIRQRGSDWSHLRPYTDTDDVRDIVWNKIRPDGIPVRERENYRDFEIISYWGQGLYDEFFVQDMEISKKSAIEKARNTITRSAQIGKYTHKEYAGNDEWMNIIHMKPKNTLMFVCNVDIDINIKHLAYHNDLIYIDIVHPFETNPDKNILFSGQIIDIESYLLEYNLIKSNQKKAILKMGGSYISCSTENDISTILNIFFKKRYIHG